MSFKLILIATAFGLASLTVLSVVFSWISAKRLCKPERLFPTREQDNYRLPYESVSFLSRGVAVFGWFIPGAARNVPRPAIILAHGWSSNAANMLPVANVLHKAGFHVFLYDARGHGISGQNRPITILKLAEDVSSAIDYLETRPDVDVKRLGVVGHSMGGASSILAATTESRIKAVVSSSSFADLAAHTTETMRKMHVPSWPFYWLVVRFIERWLGNSMESFSPENRVGQLKVPLLLIHGTSDRFTSPFNLDALHRRASPKHTKRVLVPGRGHSDVILDLIYETQVIAFLSKKLYSLGSEPQEQLLGAA